MATPTRRINRKRASRRRQRKHRGGGNNNNTSGLTVSQLKEVIKDLPGETPVFHVEFGGITRSQDATVEIDEKSDKQELHIS